MTSRDEVEEAIRWVIGSECDGDSEMCKMCSTCAGNLIAKAYREQEKEIAGLREKLLQEESLKLKYHRDNMALSARNVELADMVEELLEVARHAHEATYIHPSDGPMKLIDRCKKCGLDLRHVVHERGEK